MKLFAIILHKCIMMHTMTIVSPPPPPPPHHHHYYYYYYYAPVSIQSIIVLNARASPVIVPNP